LVLTGGTDKKIVIHTTALEKQREIQLDSTPRAIDYFDGSFIVGLRNGTIVYRETEEDDNKEIMRGHSDGEIWGLDIDHD
jgi:hypothetical protein